MGAAVAAVPLFRKIGIGSVHGYFAAGVLVGPSVFGVLNDTQAILHFSELGVAMFLFVLGLELRPQKLWATRGQILGRGFAQVAAAMVALTLVAMFVFDLSTRTAFIAAAGFVGRRRLERTGRAHRPDRAGRPVL